MRTLSLTRVDAAYAAARRRAGRNRRILKTGVQILPPHRKELRLALPAMSKPLALLYFVPLLFMCLWTALPALRARLPGRSVVESPGGPVVFFFLAACSLALIGMLGMVRGFDYTVNIMMLSRANADSDHVDLAVIAYLSGIFAIGFALFRRKQG